MLITLCLLWCRTAQADIHAVVGPDGRLYMADRPLPGASAFDPHAVSRPVSSRSASSPPLAIAPRLQHLIEQAGQISGVDANLLRAVIRVESGYNPRAVSRAGAVGLMQLMPLTARRFGVHDRFDPEQNLRGGAAYLAWLMQRFSGDLELVLAAYNAGEGAVRRHGNQIPPYAETRAYVNKVLHHYGR